MTRLITRLMTRLVKSMPIMLAAGAFAIAAFTLSRDRSAERQDRGDHSEADEALRAQLEQSNEQLTDQIAVVGKRNNRLDAVVDQLDKQMNEITGRLKALDRGLETFDDRTKEAELVRSKLQELFNGVSGSQERLKSASQGIAAEYRSLQDAMRDVKLVGPRMDKFVEAAQEDISGALSTHRRLQSQTEAIEDERAALAKSNEQLAEVVATLSELKNATQQLPHVIEQIADRAVQLKDAEDQLATQALQFPETLNALEANRQEVSQKLVQLVKQAELYEASREELSEELVGQRSTIERIEARLKQQENALAEESRQHRAAKAEINQHIAERERAEAERDQALAAKDHLEQRIADLERADSSTQRPAQDWQLLKQPQNFDDLRPAVLQAFPDTIAMPQSAVTAIDEFRSIAGGPQMAGDAWRAIGAMHEYASEEPRYKGSFYDWCQQSGHARAYPDGDVAMNESESTKNTTGKAGHSRTFLVDRGVAEKGEIEMFAHIKFGGVGQNRPRLYFYDDTAGKTGKMHIGFVGPHNKVKNAGSA